MQEIATDLNRTAPALARPHRLEALSPQEQDALKALAGSTTGPVRPAQRAQALLALSAGMQIGRAHV